MMVRFGPLGRGHNLDNAAPLAALCVVDPNALLLNSLSQKWPERRRSLRLGEKTGSTNRPTALSGKSNDAGLTAFILPPAEIHRDRFSACVGLEPVHPCPLQVEIEGASR
jgi:hypothetical protein